MGVVAIVPALALGADLRVGEQPSVGAQERITDDVYIVGGSVLSSGVIFGDLIAGGGNIVVSGSVGGDLIAGGGSVTVTSNVPDDVRVGGGSVVIQGTVGGDLLVGGGQVHITSPRVGGDVIAGGGAIRIDGAVGGDILAGGDEIYLNGPISGNVKIKANKLTLGKNTVITGDLTYSAKKEMTQEEGAVVRGEIKYEPRPDTKSSVRILAVLGLGKLAALLACALVVGLIFRRYAREIVTRVTQSPLSELGRGLIIVIVLPVLSVLLLITVVGIPLGIMGIVSFVAAMLFSWILAPILLGSIVYRSIAKRDLYEVSWTTILLGVVLYSLLGLIPVLGWIVQVGVMFASLGAAIDLKWPIVKEWR